MFNPSGSQTQRIYRNSNPKSPHMSTNNRDIISTTNSSQTFNNPKIIALTK